MAGEPVMAPRRFRSLGRLFLRVFGWRVAGTLGECQRAVVIAAPHTSSWDLPFMLAVSYVLGVQPSWLGKRELFRWPFGWALRRLGGIPVDRGARQGVVGEAVARFAESRRLFLVVPPSGTRARATHWKSGFYHVASGAGVPIVCAYLDYHERVGGVGLVLAPSGDLRADMDRIRAFYASKRGKYPEQATPVRLREEELDTPETIPSRPASAAGGKP
jgi:1-acyl-sn-glycerol-3-phosphate acyltransferase